MSTELLVASNLCKTQGGTRSLDNVSISINRGDIVGLLGLNGAGKSTALNIITGVHQPDSGSVTIAGVSSNKDPVNCRARLGFLPDKAPLYDDMRVERFLTYAARLRGANPSSAKQQTQQILTNLDLQDYRHHIIGHLSKGFQQRVGLAQALIHDPDLLILDEPSSGLDPTQANALLNVIRSRSGHRGVLFSSHQLSDVAKICTHVVVLNRGKLVYTGPIDAALQTTGRLRVTFGHPVSAQQLDDLGTFAVSDCESSISWWITPLASADQTTPVSNTIILKELLAAGLLVDTLTPEQSSLETVFHNLTGQPDTTDAVLRQ